MSSISVIIGTFGSEEWRVKALAASNSAVSQTEIPCQIIQVHADTLAQARNQGADKAHGDWLLFLDADDTLDSKYVESMSRAADQCRGPYLLQPSHRTDKDTPIGKAGEVSMIPQMDIFKGNFMIIGTLVRRDQFLRVGGFRELPIYEDWDLWIRCVLDKAKYATVPDAIYNIKVNEHGRNSANVALQMKTYKQISRRYGR